MMTVEFAGQVGDPHRPLRGVICVEEEGWRRAGKLEMRSRDGQDTGTVLGMADVVLVVAMWRCVDHVVALYSGYIIKWV